MNSSGVTSMKRFLPFLNLHLLQRLHHVQILAGSAPPSRTCHYRASLYQTHLTDSSHFTASKVTKLKQQPFKVSPKKQSRPSTAGRRLHHQQDAQMLGEKVESKQNHKPELSADRFSQTRWFLTDEVLCRGRMKIKRRWCRIKQLRRCRQVLEEME